MVGCHGKIEWNRKCAERMSDSGPMAIGMCTHSLSQMHRNPGAQNAEETGSLGQTFVPSVSRHIPPASRIVVNKIADTCRRNDCLARVINLSDEDLASLVERPKYCFERE